ncbi:MAG: PEP-CTERM sorting domain-containing protein [Planctomycetota bacterium]
MILNRFFPLTLSKATPLTCSLLVVSVGTASTTQAQSIDEYFLDRTFDLPDSWNGTGDSDDNVLFTDLPDGRILVVNGPTISVETGVGTGVFSDIGDYVVTSPTFGPTIASVSPDGTSVLIGSNFSGSVYVASTSAPTPGSTQVFSANDSDGIWLDNTNIALTNGSGVQLLDTSDGTVTTIVDNVGGGSAGITLDSSGNLYTGNGFDFAPGRPNTGLIKAFTAADIQTAITSGTPIDFQNAGVEVADLLSAGSLGFDAAGNFFVGGGDFFGGSGDFGYAALIDADAFDDRLANPGSVPLIDSSSPTDILRQFASPPATVSASQPPSWVYNEATGELLISYFNQSEVFVYAVPEPTSAGLLALGLAVGFRRRRGTR